MNGIPARRKEIKNQMSRPYFILFYDIIIAGDVMNYQLVETEQDRKDIEIMASIIWPITYKEILTPQQIKYMLNKFLSCDSIAEAIRDGFTFVLLLDSEKNKLGFMSYKLNRDKIFLSKLYLLPNAQNKGYASQAMEYLKSYKLPIELTVNKNNKNAYEKYLHLGFKVTDSVVTDIGNAYYMDDYVMQLKAN